MAQLHAAAYPARSGRLDRTSRPIDLVHLARQTMGNRHLEYEVLRMFERQVVLYFERIRAARGKLETSMGLHTLKGAAISVGAVALADLVGEAEAELAREGRLDAETVDDLGLRIAEISAYIDMLLTK